MENILTECGMLVNEVVQVNVEEEGQENASPNESNLEPEKGQPAPEGEVESTGSVMN